MLAYLSLKKCREFSVGEDFEIDETVRDCAYYAVGEDCFERECTR